MNSDKRQFIELVIDQKDVEKVVELEKRFFREAKISNEIYAPTPITKDEIIRSIKLTNWRPKKYNASLKNYLKETDKTKDDRFSHEVVNEKMIENQKLLE